MKFNIDIWLAIVAVTVTGIMTRLSLLLLSERVQLPPLLERALRFAPAAALASIAVPAVLLPQGTLELMWSPTLIAAIVTASIMLWRNNMLLALVAGVLVYSACRVWL